MNEKTEQLEREILKEAYDYAILNYTPMTHNENSEYILKVVEHTYLTAIKSDAARKYHASSGVDVEKLNKCDLIQTCIDILNENYSKFKGSNEAELHACTEIVELLHPTN